MDAKLETLQEGLEATQETLYVNPYLNLKFAQHLGPPNKNSNDYLYPKAYKDQESRHRLLKGLGWFIGFLAIFIPPLSLLCTIPLLINIHRQHPNSSMVSGIFLSIFAAVLPIFSGIVCLSSVYKAEQLRRSEDVIQKETFLSMQSFRTRKGSWRDIKADMQKENLDWDVVKFELSEDRKESKAIISQPFTGRVEVYMDRAQYNRNKEIERWGEAKSRLNISELQTFFRNQHLESRIIVNTLREKYKPSI